MIPILFEASSTSFTTNGIGRLTDSKKCKVTEERNGEYELELTYLVKGQYADQIQNEAIIVAIPFQGGSRQAFRIYSITDNLDGTMEVLANHISYDANFVPISPFNAEGISAACQGFTNFAIDTNPFTVTQIGFTNESTLYQQKVPKSLRSCLGGSEGSLLDTFSSHGHGEYEWDNFAIKFHYDRGSDKGYTIRYAKNLTEYDRERDSSDIVTGAVAYWVSEDGGTVYQSEVQRNSLYETYPTNKTALVNASDDFEEAPTLTDLNTYASVYAENLVNIKESIDISFADVDPDEDINLCDTVTVKYSYIHKGKTIKVIDYTTKIIKTVWNVLLDRYDSITVGDNKSSLSDTLSSKVDEASQAAVNAVDSKMVSVVQYVDRELGVIQQEISSISTEVHSQLTGVIAYYLMNDGETPPKDDPNWSVVFPTYEEGKSIWTLTEYTYSTGTATRTEPELLNDTEHVVDIREEFYLSLSNTTQTGGSWSEVMPTPTQGYYLWNRLKLIYDTGEYIYTDPKLAYNALYSTVISQGTSITQNEEQIALRATYDEVSQSVNNAINTANAYTDSNIAVNLSPFFGWPLDDKYNSSTNPEGYWHTITGGDYLTRLTNGWAHVSRSNSSTTDRVYITAYVMKDPNFTADSYQLLVEIKNLSKSGTISAWTNSTSSANQQYRGSSISSDNFANGTFRITVNKATEYSEATRLVEFGISVYPGSSVDCDVRVSMYKAGYTGDYIPYAAPANEVVIYEEKKTNAQITILSNQITQEVSDREESVTAAITTAKSYTDTTATALSNKDVASVKTQWYVSTSSTSLSGGSWVDQMPNISSGNYLWTRELTTFKDNTTAASTAKLYPLYRSVIDANTAITQKADSITLEAYKTALEEEITGNNAYNLMPFFSHPFEDRYNASSNPNGYWETIYNATKLNDGWAKYSKDNTSGSSTGYSYAYIYKNANFTSSAYTLLIEIRNFSKSGSGTPTIWFSSHTDGPSQYAGTGFNIANGTYRVRLTRTSTSFANCTRFLRIGQSVPAGCSSTFEIRASLYKDGYTGGYIPYITDHGDLEDELSSITTTLNESSSTIQQLTNQISTNVTEITRVERSIAGIAQNEAATLIASSESKMSTQIDQTAQSITATISSVQTNVANNSRSISEMYTYFTFASNGLTVGKSTSDIRGVFGNSSLDFVDKSGNKLAWLSTSEGLGADFLAVGDAADTSKRWKIVTDSTGNYLRFTRHS